MAFSRPTSRGSRRWSRPGSRCATSGRSAATPCHSPPPSWRPRKRKDNMAPIVRPGILDIAPYIGGEAGLAGQQRVIRLASNESPLGPSPRAAEAYRALASELHRYPDGAAQALREAIGRTFDLDPARIVCGAGSDELIGLLTRAYAGPGDEVLYSRHGFLM